jgi:hypothetical protein
MIKEILYFVVGILLIIEILAIYNCQTETCWDCCSTLVVSKWCYAIWIFGFLLLSVLSWWLFSVPDVKKVKTEGEAFENL